MLIETLAVFMIYIVLITILYGLLPLIFIHLNSNLNGIRAIYPLVCVIFIASLYEFIGSFLLEINVELWFLIYDLLVFLSVHYFFYTLLNKKYAKLFITVILLLILSYGFLSFDERLLNYLQISAFFNVFQTLTIFLFSIIWFKNIFQECEIENLLESPHFYFISGLLIYYCGSVVLFLSASHIYETNHSDFQYYWLLNIILTFVLRTSLIVGIWKARRE